MPKKSAGIVLYRFSHTGILEVFLVHPGGPFWAKKDNGAWSIPKGELDEGEDPLKCAIREFEEETGTRLRGNFTPLKTQKQKGGKIVHAWALEGDIDEKTIKSNVFEMEWPPKSGIRKQYPEVDKAAWLTLLEAKQKIISGQVPFLEELENILHQI
jgi:predicted NUDIX family NTP pyrophosphohydrolase